MRIGIDCRTILNPKAGNLAGIAHYTYYLVKNLLKADKLNEYVLFFDHRAKDIIHEFLEPNTSIRFFKYSQYKRFLPFIYSHMLTASTLDQEKLHVYHSPANIVPVRYKGKFCVTVHDLAIYRRPDLFPSRQGFSVKYIVPQSIDGASRIIAVSNSTKNDIVQFFEVDEAKVQVIYEGVEAQRFQLDSSHPDMLAQVMAKYDISRDYLLFVGTLEPRKNLIRLLEAFYELLKRRPEIAKRYQLVLAGGKGWLYEEIFEEVTNRGLDEHVVFTGYLPAEDIPRIFAAATGFVYPSMYEGFGLPVLEAMAAGVPVITSNVSAMPEVAGEATLLVDPLDIEGISRAMERLLSDDELRRSLSEKGRARAQGFTWEKCAKETMEVYKVVSRM